MKLWTVCRDCSAQDTRHRHRLTQLFRQCPARSVVGESGSTRERCGCDAPAEQRCPKAGGKQGVPQGGVISPLLSNIYLTEVDRMLERAKEALALRQVHLLRICGYPADDLVILIDAYKRHDWPMAAVEKRLPEELAELQVEINEQKSWIVDLGRGESFGFQVFVSGAQLRGVWRAHYTPKLKKRTALLRKLKDMFRRHQSTSC